MRRASILAIGICAVTIAASGTPGALCGERAPDSHHQAAHHAAAEHPASLPLPAVTIEVVPDSMSGWNVHAQVTNFEFTPRSVGSETRPGRGHAHLYVNGEKVARLYGPSFHLTGLEPGVNEVRFTLNADSHAVYTWKGEEIAATAVVRVGEAEGHQEAHAAPEGGCPVAAARAGISSL